MSEKILFYFIAAGAIGICLGFLYFWRKISKSKFKCPNCGNIHRPFVYKSSPLGFLTQGLGGYMSFFFWLPLFFKKIYFKCPQCEKWGWQGLLKEDEEND